MDTILEKDRNNIILESISDEDRFLEKLSHYLPAQMPLKDFVHHNTLHAYQHKKFFEATQQACETFGYTTTLSIEEFRKLFAEKRIREDILEHVIIKLQGEEKLVFWKDRLLHGQFDKPTEKKIGKLRNLWREAYQIDLNGLVRPSLFRIINAYFDQGVSISHLPAWEHGILASLAEIEKNSFISLFKRKRAKKLLINGVANNSLNITDLLKILLGDLDIEKNPHLYAQYLYDQQFMHSGWSGMVAVLEHNPHGLLDERKAKLKDLVILELLLEIDALDAELGKNWLPLPQKINVPYLAPIHETPDMSKDYFEAVRIWQNAFEWTYYDSVLAGIQFCDAEKKLYEKSTEKKDFQAMFCIDDREGSFRRHLEKLHPNCETFGVPGFFGVPFWYKPLNGKSYMKLCPVPINPKHLIKEIASQKHTHKKEILFSENSHHLFRGFLFTIGLGFWAIIRLIKTMFRPSLSSATVCSLNHTHHSAKLTVENQNSEEMENGYQIGFKITEMAVLVENLLRNIGFLDNYADLVYVVAHGATSVNNPHYAAYDCGACSGRPGSVNARVFCSMANNTSVRKILEEKGIVIPETTQFIPAIHDTTRDEVVFYDTDFIFERNKAPHQKIQNIFKQAGDENAKERARRFDTINIKQKARKIHKEVKKRAISIYEPRPELNHATDALCIVGRRKLSHDLFLDRRSFLNSYDYSTDLEGTYLFNVLSACTPVCVGINLEYYFSRVDNHYLGVGTKLPLNVMGLIGVANGIDGDLKTGLPLQMVEVHDPVRLMMIVEQKPEIVLKTIQKNPALYEWYNNEWANLACFDPYTHQFYIFRNGEFNLYKPIQQSVPHISGFKNLIETHHDNIQVSIID